jgi:glucosylceramidase
MKIDRRSFIAASSSAVVLARSQLSLSATPPSAGTVAVYTTADKTDHRLSPTATANFKPMGQPLETQICVFVDPTKTFQTFLGIGGALTDASAETFAKLPKA